MCIIVFLVVVLIDIFGLVALVALVLDIVVLGPRNITLEFSTKTGQ